jgi:pentatricopeptide repeat protein
MLNLSLSACVNAKQPERAWDLVQHARKFEHGGNTDGIVDIVSYNTVMKGFGAAKNRQRCFQCMQDLVDHGLQPDDITLGSILDTCIADNDLAVANELGNLLLSSGRQISSIMWTLLIKGLVRAGSVEKAIALYKEMKKRAAQPDLILYSVLIKGLVDQHDIEKAIELAEDLKAQGLIIDDIILTHLLEGCRHANNFKLGKQIFKEAMDAGMKPSDVTLVTMLKLCGRAGKFHEAFETVKNWESVNGQAVGDPLHMPHERLLALQKLRPGLGIF